MKSIGIRVKPSEIIYAIIDIEKKKVIVVDTIKVPNSLILPEQLSFIRNNLLDIFNEYKVDRAGIRTTESVSFNKDLKRIQIESVIQEMLSSSTVEKYYIGQIASISKLISIPREDFKKYVNNEKTYKPIGNWEEHNKEEREALLTALGASYV